ncbi:MAG: NADP-dependent oxidoreductase [Phenylobacterium sp.]
MQNANRVLRLTSRPDGLPGPEHFTLTEEPHRPLEPGEVRLATAFVSIDPAMRVWMDERPGYTPGVKLGEVMRALGVAKVVESRANGLSVGAWVEGTFGLQSHPVVPVQQARPVDAGLGSPEDYLTLLGLPGVTAHLGLFEIAGLKSGETVLVSAASGGVGQIVGQIARAYGCRVVGICGGPAKCDMVVREFGFDAAVDHGQADDAFDRALGEACPDGVDVYFDNVGGRILEMALNHIRDFARIVICGRISQTAGQPVYPIGNLGEMLVHRARMQGFTVGDLLHAWPSARRDLARLRDEGKLKTELHLLDGLENAPTALGMLFRGENRGKMAVRVQ